MKSVMRQLLFGIAFVAAPSAVFGQSWCPQALMGQMNGSYYYNSQICGGSGCSTTNVATDSAYDCGGCCTNCCGTACADTISSLTTAPAPAAIPAPAPAAEAAPKVDVKKAGDNGDDQFDIVFIRCKQAGFADFSKAGFKGPGSHVTVKRYKVLVDIPDKGTYYFHCIEAIHKDFPDKPLRIGQELDGDAPIPPSATVKTISMSRTKGAGHYHRLKVSDTVHFDVTSVNDLGTTP